MLEFALECEFDASCIVGRDMTFLVLGMFGYSSELLELLDENESLVDEYKVPLEVESEELLE